MGANTFTQTGRGATARAAFIDAVQDARHEYGNGGYTGSLAEKNSFVEIAVPAGVDPKAFARELVEEDDDRISDKWGPAGCVKVAENEYHFFGWASS